MGSNETVCESNQTEKIYDMNKTIHQLFEEQVDISANRIAAVYRNETITYGQLNEKANQLAKKLRDLGVKPNMVIGLMVNRSLDMLIGMLAILKSGGCYLPIDPKFPVSRIQHMLTDSKTTILITQQEVLNIEKQVEGFSGQIVYLNEEIYRGNTSNLENINCGSDLAYVIYTSGSTGVPKGVMLEHRGVHNFFIGMLDKIAFTKNKKIVSLTTISFDIFVLESLLPLTLGMEIVIANPMTFVEDMQDKRVEMLQTTPSTVQLILNDERSHEYIEHLTDIMLGGEPFPQTLLKRLKEITSAKIYNMYGPTETTVWSMVKELTDTDYITVGHPIANTQIYLVQEDGRIVSNLEEEGEICIAGDGLARGYLFREELTRKKFGYNDSLPNVRMYHTGDLGKWLKNGEIEFLGRIDSQVKIRGFRIELGEIESALLNVAEVKDCVVGVKEREDGAKYMVAYYIADQYLCVSEMIDALKKVLPEYEIPSFFLKIDEIPLTPNGKVNRLALPDLKLNRANLNTELILPKTQQELEIADLWKSLLGYDEVGINDNFFDLGGNSILVSQLQIELEKVFGIKINVAELFVNNTIAMQSVLIDQCKVGKSQSGLRFVQLPEIFYQSNIIGFESVVVKHKLQEEWILGMNRVSKKFNISEASMYAALYLFLISNQLDKNEVELIIPQNQMEELSVIRVDVSVYEELEDLCIKVEQEMQAHTIMVQQQVLGESKVKDVFFTFDQQAKTGQHPMEGEIRLNLSELHRCKEIALSFNAKQLKTEKVNQFLSKYEQLIEAIVEQVE